MNSFLNETNESLLLKKVYDHLQDDLSRDIYLSRSAFSLTDDRNQMKNIIRSMVVSKFLLKELENHKKQKKILFGAGAWGKSIKNFFPEIDWFCYVDNKKNGQNQDGLKIISVEELKNYKTDYIIISVLFNSNIIEEQLLSTGFKSENIINLGNVAKIKQYFDLPEFPHDEEEIFVDAGGFIGETALSFARWSKGKYSHIYLFEANESLFLKCEENLRTLPRCTLCQKGLWNKESTLYFVNKGQGSHIIESSDQNFNVSNSISKIFVTSLDEQFKNEKVTFIKMDIEGAEIKALEGAKNLIVKYKPKLAISVYHQRKDIWEIPMLLLKYNPDYKFYLRVYSFTGNDTVLYAF